MLARLQFKFANCVGGDDGSDALIADGDHHLREQTINLDLDDGAGKLVASADARCPKMCRSGGEELLKSAQWECDDGRRVS